MSSLPVLDKTFDRPTRSNSAGLSILHAAGNTTSLASQGQIHAAARSNKAMGLPQGAISSGQFGIF